jgi:pilus assembly protein CpaB
MRPKGIIIIIAVFALLTAVAASIMVTSFLKRKAMEAGAPPSLKPVVVSVADLTFGKTLEASDLRVAMFPEEAVPKGAVSTIDSLIGQTTKVFLAEAEPVLVSKLSSIGGGLSLLIAPTMRAVSIKVDKVSGVSGFVLPGDRVDVIAISRQIGGSSGGALAKTILQNIEILAAGEKTEKKGNEPITVQSVTLLIDPTGAEALALAASEGIINLTLRNPNDTQTAAMSEGLTSNELFGSGKKKEVAPSPKPKPQPVVQKPSAPPYKRDSLTIIRGTSAKKQPPAAEKAQPQPSDSTRR